LNSLGVTRDDGAAALLLAGAKIGHHCPYVARKFFGIGFARASDFGENGVKFHDAPYKNSSGVQITVVS
jgi:hypothetical protein